MAAARPDEARENDRREAIAIASRIERLSAHLMRIDGRAGGGVALPPRLAATLIRAGVLLATWRAVLESDVS